LIEEFRFWDSFVSQCEKTHFSNVFGIRKLDKKFDCNLQQKNQFVNSGDGALISPLTPTAPTLHPAPAKTLTGRLWQRKLRCQFTRITVPVYYMH
jgi:hypothetical protein